MQLPEDFRAQSREHWNKQAEGWEATRDAMRTNTMPVAAWLIDAIDPQPGHTLLELAAGPGDTGLLAAELVEPGGTLICSDFSPEMLQVAQRRAEELGIGNVRFKQIDADTSFDVEAASIDGVLCRWGYMLMADADNALRETRRILRPGGRVALAAWAEPEANPWHRTAGRALVERGLLEPPQPGTPGPYSWAEPGYIGTLLDAAGFAEHHVEPLDFAFHYRSPADWWQTLLSCSSSMSNAVAAASDDVVDEIAAQLDEAAEDHRAPDGTLEVPARTWVAWAAA